MLSQVIELIEKHERFAVKSHDIQFACHLDTLAVSAHRYLEVRNDQPISRVN